MAKRDDYVRYTIRVPANLYARIQDAAGEKSINAEIVETLQEAYPSPLNLADVVLQTRELVQRLRETKVASHVFELRDVLADAEHALSEIGQHADEDDDPRER